MHSFHVPRYLVRILGGILLAGLVAPGLGWAQQPLLIPQPRELQTHRENFKIQSNLKIVLLPPMAAEDRGAAESMAEELKTVTQVDFPIVSSVPAANIPAIVLGRLEQPSMKNLLDARSLNPSGIGEQGYVLDVTPNQV